FLCGLRSAVVLAIILEPTGCLAKVGVDSVNLVLSTGVVQGRIIERSVEGQFVLVGHIFNVLQQILDIGLSYFHSYCVSFLPRGIEATRQFAARGPQNLPFFVRTVVWVSLQAVLDRRSIMHHGY